MLTATASMMQLLQIATLTPMESSVTQSMILKTERTTILPMSTIAAQMTKTGMELQTLKMPMLTATGFLMSKRDPPRFWRLATPVVQEIL